MGVFQIANPCVVQLDERIFPEGIVLTFLYPLRDGTPGVNRRRELQNEETIRGLSRRRVWAGGDGAGNLQKVPLRLDQAVDVS